MPHWGLPSMLGLVATPRSLSSSCFSSTASWSQQLLLSCSEFSTVSSAVSSLICLWTAIGLKLWGKQCSPQYSCTCTYMYDVGIVEKLWRHVICTGHTPIMHLPFSRGRIVACTFPCSRTPVWWISLWRIVRCLECGCPGAERGRRLLPWEQSTISKSLNIHCKLSTHTVCLHKCTVHSPCMYSHVYMIVCVCIF